MMIFTFTISFMGIVLSPSFSMWSYSANNPKAFSYYQVWGSAFIVGLLLFIFTTFQGIGASLLGANAEIKQQRSFYQIPYYQKFLLKIIH